jgi:DNA invertase Pin-like site-specific DNA recombinase
MTNYGYIRVSSDEQKQTGLSLEAQKEKLIQAGVPPENIYCDAGKSGGFKPEQIIFGEMKNGGEQTFIHYGERIQLYNLMLKAKEGSTIYICKYDRISRSIFFMEYLILRLQKKQITLKIIDESEEKLMRNLLTMMAEEELLKTADRNDTIAESQFNKGIQIGKAVIGYQKNVRDKITKELRYPNLQEGCLVIDPEKSKMVIDIFRRMANKEYYKDICKIYDLNGQTLYNIIRNRTYLGEIKYGEESKKTESVPQIITEELWLNANKNIKSKN